MVRALAGMPETQSSSPALFLFSFVREENKHYYEKRRKIMDKKLLLGAIGAILTAAGTIVSLVSEIVSKEKK